MHKPESVASQKFRLVMAETRPEAAQTVEMMLKMFTAGKHSRHQDGCTITELVV